MFPTGKGGNNFRKPQTVTKNTKLVGIFCEEAVFVIDTVKV